jgi:hypothetical protein
MITIARYALIAMAVILAPIYGLWILGGRIADRRAQRRASSLLKGHAALEADLLNK